jgi:hypothetical protein
VVVSGSNTPIIPLPFAATDFSAAIAAKSAVNDVALTDPPAVVVVLPAAVVEDELDLLLLLHAPSANNAATDATAIPLTDAFMFGSSRQDARNRMDTNVNKA